jgi:hypothetical protein
MHAIEKAVYARKPFVKGRPTHELPVDLVKLTEFPWVLETDYTSFESGFSPEYCDVVECALWRYMLKNNPLILDLVLRCYYQTRGGHIVPRKEKLMNKLYVAKTVGTRMSGEMWTSLANGFANLMNIKYLCHKLKIRCKGFVEGDDGLFGMDSRRLKAHHFEELGFKIKMKYGRDLAHTSFCGNVFDPEVMKIIIAPEQIARVFWSCSSTYIHSSRKILDELLRAKAMSLYCQGKHTPIAGKLALKILQIIGPGGIRIGEGNAWWWNERIAKMLETETFAPVDVDLRSRDLYEQLYGISVRDQLSIEDHISRMTKFEDLEIPYQFMEDKFVEGERFLSREFNYY